MHNDIGVWRVNSPTHVFSYHIYGILFWSNFSVFMVILHILLSGEKIKNLKLLAPENGTVIQLQSLKTFFNLLSFSTCQLRVCGPCLWFYRCEELGNKLGRWAVLPAQCYNRLICFFSNWFFFSSGAFLTFFMAIVYLVASLTILPFLIIAAVVATVFFSAGILSYLALSTKKVGVSFDDDGDGSCLGAVWGSWV